MRTVTKKELALSLQAAGRTTEEIAETLKCSPYYVQEMTGQGGDLYTDSVKQNEYARLFTGVLRFKNLESAQESVRQIDHLCNGFEDTGDARGVHQAELMALIGKNRAQATGKPECAELFRLWLVRRLTAQQEGQDK